MANFYAEYPDSSGGGGGVSSLNGQTGALTLVAGTGITITPGAGTLTIDATGGGGGATTELDNLTTTAINADLIFDTAASYSIHPGDFANINGRSLSVLGGNATVAGTGGTPGRGGALNLTAGGVPASGAGFGGAVNIVSGDGFSRPGGRITLQAGNGSGVFVGGSVQINSGLNSDATGAGGNIGLLAADGGATSGAGGSLDFTAGASVDDLGGFIALNTQAGVGGIFGLIQFKNGSQGTAGHVWTQTDTNGSGEWAAVSAGTSLPNDVYLTGRNAADDTDLPIVKIDSSNFATFGGLMGNITIRPDNGKININSSNVITHTALATVLLPNGQAQNITFMDATGTNFIALVSPDAPGEDSVLHLPVGVGTAGQVLTTDGNNPATLSWEDAGAGGGATTSLNNLASTAINADLIFGTGVDGLLKSKDDLISKSLSLRTGEASTDTSGGLVLQSGNNSTTDIGKATGSVIIASGDITSAGDSSNSGIVSIHSGAAGSGNSSFSGSVTITSGNGAYQSGDTNIWTGDGSVDDAYSGDITLYTGSVSGTGISGAIKTRALGFQLSTTGDEPVATVAYVGMIRYVPGAMGVADELRICVKDAADTYSWKVFTLT